MDNIGTIRFPLSFLQEYEKMATILESLGLVPLQATVLHHKNVIEYTGMSRKFRKVIHNGENVFYDLTVYCDSEGDFYDIDVTEAYSFFDSRHPLVEDDLYDADAEEETTVEVVHSWDAYTCYKVHDEGGD